MGHLNSPPPLVTEKNPRAYLYIYVPWGEEKKVRALLEKGWVIVGVDKRYGTPMLRMEEKP